MTKHAVSGESKLLQFRVERSDGNSLVLTASDKQQFNSWQDEFNKVWLVVQRQAILKNIKLIISTQLPSQVVNPPYKF